MTVGATVSREEGHPGEKTLPKGNGGGVRRGRGKAPPSHLLQLPPPQLAPSFVQSHTKDKGPRSAWPSAPSSLKALKETAPPPCRPGAVGLKGVGCSEGPDPTHSPWLPSA